MGFYGRVTVRLDDKSRIAIPTRYRAELGSEPIYLTFGKENCISIYPQAAFREKEARVKALGDETREARNERRRFFSRIAELKPDAQGRVIVPVEHLDHAGLTKDTNVILAGDGDVLEVWEPGRLAAIDAEDEDEEVA